MTQQEHGRAGFSALLRAAAPLSVRVTLPDRPARPARATPMAPRAASGAADIAWRAPPTDKAAVVHA
jgi:hypothetical protein